MSNYETDPAITKAMAELDQTDLPVYEITGRPDPFGAGTAVSFYTTDLGKHAVTGLCAGMNRVNGPIRRGLAARSTTALPRRSRRRSISINQRFAMNLTGEQKRQLVAFLNTVSATNGTACQPSTPQSRLKARQRRGARLASD